MLAPPNRYKASHLFAQPQSGIDTSHHILNAPTIVHDHDFFEIALVTGGTGIHISAVGEQPAQKGDLWILAPGAWHAYRDCRDLEVCNCCFAAVLLERELCVMRHDAETNHFFFQGPQSLERRGIINFPCPLPSTLESWRALHGSSSSMTRVARLLLFIDELTGFFPVRHREPVEKKQHFVVTEAMNILEKELQKEWTLKMLGQQVHMSPGYLSRVFKEATGLPPLEWLHRLRCERAAQLLLQTELGIAEIGVQVGWSDPNLFARRFRAAYGVSASHYRARFRRGIFKPEV